MKIRKLDHCSVLVESLETALTFYEEILGLVPDPARPVMGYRGAWLNVGNEQIHLLELPSPDPRTGRPEHVGRDRHMALRITGLDELIERLEARNHAFTRSVSGRAAIFFRDPDGNGIECIETG